MLIRRPYHHGHVSVLGDTELDESDEAEDPMQWTPANDPDQGDYAAQADDSSDEDEDFSGGQGPCETEGTTPRAAQSVHDRPGIPGGVTSAFNGLTRHIQTRFSQVSSHPMPHSLAKHHIGMAVFIHEDGRVKVLR